MHVVAFCAPSVALYVPGLHLIQTSDVDAAIPVLYVPGLQSIHTEATEAPALGLHFPRTHEMHVVAFCAAGVAL